MSDQNTFNAVGWFEIPVTDMDRAVKFYEAALGYKLDRHPMGPLEMAWLPMHEDAKGASGSLVKYAEFYKPSTEGTLIYFTSTTGNLNVDCEKVKAAGGQIQVPPKQISPDYGYMCVILDSEGNRIALHSRLAPS